jgi:hypothetical protein
VGLFGTPEECAARARTIRAAGVDEVAHLLDFGVPFDTVLDHMSYLDQFRELVGRSEEAEHTEPEAS